MFVVNLFSASWKICASGWQKLAAFRRMRKWPQSFCQACNCYFRDKFVIFARNCKFANSIHYDMQYIPSNSALLAQETLIFTPKKTFWQRLFVASRNFCHPALPRQPHQHYHLLKHKCIKCGSSSIVVNLFSAPSKISASSTSSTPFLVKFPSRVTVTLAKYI